MRTYLILLDHLSNHSPEVEHYDEKIQQILSGDTYGWASYAIGGNYNLLLELDNDSSSYAIMRTGLLEGTDIIADVIRNIAELQALHLKILTGAVWLEELA